MVVLFVKKREGEMILNFAASNSGLACARSNTAARLFATFVVLCGNELKRGASMSVICFSYAEVTSISRRGFWLQFCDEELYLPFVEFPRFEHATVAQISHVECPCSGHLYWPALDLDLSVESIRNPMAAPHRRSKHGC
jgi:hypothetical protein